jgi:retinol dehydrogenase-14
VLGHWDDASNFNSFFRYADTKLCVSALCRKLAELAPADEIIVNNPCPGLVRTKGLDKNLNLVLKGLMYVVRGIQGRSIEEGARTMIYASVVAGKETNGNFMMHNKVEP